MKRCGSIWLFLVFSHLVNARTTSHLETSLPIADLIQDSINPKESGRSNGFTYKVRFPPQTPKPMKETSFQINSQLNSDSFQSESMQNNNLETINHDNTNIITSALKTYPDTIIQHGVPTEDSVAYVSFDNVVPPSYTEGYTYERPNIHREDNKLHDLFNSSPSDVPIDSTDIFDKESIEILSSLNKSNSVDESSPIDRETDLPYSQESQILSISMEPETYSLVKFTGSVFTPEGLPALGSEENFPVDYKFSYVIQGQPSLGHVETRVGDQSSGMYWVTLPDGRIQEVRYTVGGEEGYQPIITYRQAGDKSRRRREG